jgi:hypothetical protein
LKKRLLVCVSDLAAASLERVVALRALCLMMPDGDLRYIMDGVEMLNGACDPVGCLALVALHFLSLTGVPRSSPPVYVSGLR